MKHLSALSYLLILLSLNSCKDDSLNMKPEVTKDWFYSSGESYEYSTATNAFSLDEPEKGEGLVWDFYDAEGNPQEDLLVVNPTGLSGSELFPEANIAIKDDGIDAIFYYKKTNDTLFHVGNYFNTTFHHKYSDPLVVSIAPLNFEESFEDSYTADVYINGNFSSGDTYHVSTEYGGTGTIKTPYGTFNNCVMLEKTTTNSSGEVTSIVYNFYKDSLINRLASYSLSLNSNGVTYTPRFSWGEKK